MEGRRGGVEEGGRRRRGVCKTKTYNQPGTLKSSLRRDCPGKEEAG